MTRRKLKPAQREKWDKLIASAIARRVLVDIQRNFELFALPQPKKK